MVRIRQVLDALRHRMLFVPILAMVIAVGLSQVTILIDDHLDSGRLPQIMETTIDNGRSILSSVAGGLIAAITLLLSLMMVTVQLASSQFSPRALRNWFGDRTLQFVIGMVLGTTVFCLLVLRQTRSFSDATAVVPNVSVIVAVMLGIFSLVAMVVAVDHMTNSLRVGSVTTRLAAATVRLIEEQEAHGSPALAAGRPMPTEGPPPNALAVESSGSGWIQQISTHQIMEAVADGTCVWLASPLGAFVGPRAPLAWLWPPPDDEDEVGHRVHSAFALGDTRTMQQDVGFGILQLVDIAVRALSPGVNDPNTANDVIAHLGAVMTVLWERPSVSGVTKEDDRTVIVPVLDHGGYLRAAFDQIRRYGVTDVSVVLTLVTTLRTLRDETVRRNLPGPVEPIDDMLQDVLDGVRSAGHEVADLHAVNAVVDDDLTVTARSA